VEAVKGVSFHLQAGEMISPIGANGAGKSIILRSLTGLVQPSAEAITFENTSLIGLSPHQIIRMGIGHVPEGRRLFPKMTVLENLKMGAYLQRSKTDVVATLERIYAHFPILKKRGHQRAGSLSGGEQQMPGTARALMNRPRLLMLDEPSIGLSPIMTTEIGKIAQQINVMLALTIAQRSYVLETGRIVMQGEVQELLQDEGVKKAYLGI